MSAQGSPPLGDGTCPGRVSCGDLGKALRYDIAEEDEGDLSPLGADRSSDGGRQAPGDSQASAGQEVANEHGKGGNEAEELVSRAKVGSEISYEVRWAGLDDVEQDTMGKVSKLRMMGLGKVVIDVQGVLLAKGRPGPAAFPHTMADVGTGSGKALDTSAARSSISAKRRSGTGTFSMYKHVVASERSREALWVGVAGRRRDEQAHCEMHNTVLRNTEKQALGLHGTTVVSCKVARGASEAPSAKRRPSLTGFPMTCDRERAYRAGQGQALHW